MVAKDPHHSAVKIALDTNDRLGALFTRAGSADRPNGLIMASYRNALRALRGAESRPAMREVMNGLSDQVGNHARVLLSEASVIGIASARAQLLAYDAPAPERETDQTKLEEALAVILALLAVQSNSAFALLALDADIALIIGDNSRQGVVRPGTIITALLFWLVSLAVSEFTSVVEESQIGFQKQAVATIDDHTTDCCLRVHGQVQPLSKPFHLTGTPRYADYIDAPPFHGFCRTTPALYLPEHDTGLTVRMLKEAQDQIAANQSVTESAKKTA